MRVVAEKFDDAVAEAEADHRTKRKEDRAHTGGKPKGLPDPPIETGTVAEAAKGLKTLAETHHGSHDKHGYAIDDGHARNGCIAINLDRDIERYRGYTGQALPRKRRTAAVEYLFEQAPRGGKEPRMHSYIAFTSHHAQEDGKRNDLSDHCGQCGTCHSHVEQEDE